MKQRMRKVYKEIFPKPPAKTVEGRKGSRGRRGSISANNSKTSVKICTITFLKEEKSLFSLHPPVFEFEANYLNEYSNKRKTLKDLIATITKKIGEDEGYASVSTSTPTSTSPESVVENSPTSDSTNFEEPVPKKYKNEEDILPENFDMEFIHGVDGVSKIRASESAMKCLAIWDEQNSRHFIINTKNDGSNNSGLPPSTLLSLAELKLPEVCKIEEIDANRMPYHSPSPAEMLFSSVEDNDSGQGVEESTEDTVDPVTILDFSVLIEDTPPRDPSEVEMDNKFAEILKELGLNSVQDLDMKVADVDVHTDAKEERNFGLGADFWKDLNILDKELDAFKLMLTQGTDHKLV